MAILLLIAISSLIWLFWDFIAALFFAVLIATATFGYYKKLNNRFSENISAFILTTIISIIFMLPLNYILLTIGIEVSKFVEIIQLDKSLLTDLLSKIELSLPMLSDTLQQEINNYINNNILSIINNIKTILLSIIRGIFSSSSNFISFLFITIFSLFYFYKDGEYLVEKIKDILPLKQELNNIILKQFLGLSVILVSNVFIIAILQGTAFAIVMAFFNLPWMFLGVLVAIASFIPIIGAALIWVPVSIYLISQGEYYQAGFVAGWGILIIGGLIDNLIRPLLLKKMAQKINAKKSVLEYTLITVLSTFAGIMKFGILGLFLGPIISAMAITIFEVYTISKK